MISTTRLLGSIADGRVAFDTQGNPVEIDLAIVHGPATLLVAPVTDAVKRMSGGVVESLDRDQMWVVEAIALEADVLVALGEVELTAEELWQAVDQAGFSWQISPTSSP
jgi:hypothetical protein